MIHTSFRRLTSSARPPLQSWQTACVALALSTTGATAGMAGCAKKAEPAPETSSEAGPTSATSKPSTATSREAGIEDASVAEGPMIAGLFPQTPIMSDMEWPAKDKDKDDGRRETRDRGAVRIGYLRQGGRVPVVPEAHPKANCPDGWYELVSGGFVCGRYATLDLNHPRVRLAAHPPYLDQPLPYDYGYNITNGTPLYKTAPSREDRLKFEPWLKPRAPRTKAVPIPDEAPAYSASASDFDGGVTPTAIVLTAGGMAAGTPGDPLGAFDPWDSGVPWYLRDFDGGKPQVTLDELKEDGGPISRRMVKGFYLALDKEIDTGPSKSLRWWRTTGGLITPFDRIFVTHLPTDFHGVWLGQDPPQADLDAADAGPVDAGGYMTSPRPSHKTEFPVAFILWVHAHKYTLTDDHKKANAGEVVRRFTVVHLTGEEAVVAGVRFLETDEGWWMRTNEGTAAKTTSPPKDLRPGEKWIDVNLTTQTLVAFEGDKPVYATLVSTGKMNDDDKEKDHRTKPGSFRIREKHIAATMDGDVASDGPYSIEDVPWIMYFNASIALHGAFWHSNFGHVQSHGCVNLSPVDAKTLFGWTDPQLPAGWHGVMATDDRPGTRVIVHDPPESHPKWAP
jgi:lipoprotein-anchoring transpeptidase ErfK/SrfK